MKIPDKNAEKSPFRVPDGYFEEVNSKIISATTGTCKSASKPRLSIRFRPYLLAVASVAGFIILSYTAIKLTFLQRINPQTSEVIPGGYFSPYFNEIDIFSLEENTESLTIPEEGPDVSNAEIIEYLVLENIEISDIYEQL
jgi:hypothetical protein